jgi:hypothetical protein
MAEVLTQVTPFMTYEHRNKDGKLVSLGKNRLLRHGKLEFTQELADGTPVYKSIQLHDTGLLLEEKYYTDGKETEKLVFAYDEKGEFLSVTDKAGGVSLSPLGEEKLAIK